MVLVCLVKLILKVDIIKLELEREMSGYFDDILRAFIGKSVVVYFDDILIYSKGLDEHIEHLQSVLIVLRKEKLYANLKKCSFCTNQIVFLGR